LKKFILSAAGALILLIGLAAALLSTKTWERSPSVDAQSVRIAVLPDQDAESLRRLYQPLIAYLREATGLDIALIIPGTYGELLDMFAAKSIDVAFFGGVTFVTAHRKHGAEPLVMRDVDVRFRSYFLARANRAEKKIEDFAGKRFAFGSRLSTSGHLMPRHFLKSKNIDPESFFGEVTYSGAHDKTAILVRDGIADLGVANAAIIDAMYAEGRLKSDEVRIVWETPPYSDYVWAIQKDAAPEIRMTLLNAFLRLSPIEKKHAEILNAIGAGGFLPAHMDDFRELTDIAVSTGML